MMFDSLTVSDSSYALLSLMQIESDLSIKMGHVHGFFAGFSDS
jgi:hypothetical protein